MSGKKRWKLAPFKTLKIKVYEETLRRYQLVLKAKNKTMQQDIEDYINKTIS